ncbi:hypothetical protein KBX31_01350 [Liquorilactobacillus satsumensis]|nr:hypothetical protein [Liquorilactobacillus satsumensis]MCP9311943.1 hypothetical protein [Liquorilactobacillus satsumensis]
MLPFYKHNLLNAGSDMQFHLNRINEIYQNMRNGGFFPYLSTYSFNHMGTPLNLLYPAPFLFVFAALRFVISNPVTATYAGISLIIFAALSVTYFTGMKYWNKQRRKSLLCALFYGLSASYFEVIFQSFDLGEAFAMIFLPLVIYGTYSLFFRDKAEWVLLALGMSGVIYSHVLSTVIYVFYALIILVIALVAARAKVRQRLQSLLYAVLLTSCLTAFFIVGFVTTILKTHLAITQVFVLEDHTDGLGTLLVNSLNNEQLGILPLFFIFLLPLVWRRLKTEARVIAGIGLGTCLLVTPAFPWGMLQNTPFAFIQFPTRLLVVASLFLAVTMVNVFAVLQISAKKKLIPIFLLPLLLFSGNTYLFFNSTKNQPLINYQPNASRKMPLINFQVGSKDFNNLLGYNAGVGSTDYWPQGSSNYAAELFAGTALIDNKKVQIERSLQPNGATFEVFVAKKGKAVDLPMLNYHTYTVTVNGKVVSYTNSKRNTIKVKLQHGKNQIKVTYQPTALLVWSKYLSLLAALGTIWLLFKKRK